MNGSKRMSGEARRRAVEGAVGAGWQWAKREGIAQDECRGCALAYSVGYMTAEKIRDATRDILLRFADLIPERQRLAKNACMAGQKFARDRDREAFKGEDKAIARAFAFGYLAATKELIAKSRRIA
jgi:hypothetical protein